MARYTAQLYMVDTSVRLQSFNSVHACRRWAEDNGTLAHLCRILVTKTGREIGRHVRHQGGDGTRWFRAAPDTEPRDEL